MITILVTRTTHQARVPLTSEESTLCLDGCQPIAMAEAPGDADIVGLALIDGDGATWEWTR